ncbi:hypothetical protein BDV93DRAFT_51810 [Ceratobasidium sp. AG-I]|nr:hypothetical protein BDV93DRAFT_51810 [Ceratobasidium sp. AG-I]
MLKTCRKHWYYILALARLGFESYFVFDSLVTWITTLTWNKNPQLLIWNSWYLVFWLVSWSNSAFLSTYNFFYTNTRLGSFLAQQVIAGALVFLGFRLHYLRDH